MSTEVPPNQTIYINNLNEKIKKDELVKSLNAIFSQFGKIMEIVACKTFKLKGQAWVVFEEASAATNALRQMQGFPFYDKPMRINYAKTKSDAVAKADGSYVPKEKRKKLEERAEKKKREPQDRGSGHSHGFNSGLSRPMMPEAPAPPNSILFVTSLPHDVTSSYLQMLFGRFPGFKEVRTVETKPGIAFVEYENELQATIAKDELQNMRIGQNVMQISYAKK